MPREGWRFGSVLLVASLSLASPATAASTNEDCLTCHADPDLKAADGRKLTVDGSRFGGSAHGGLSCTDCHADLASAELPHAEKLARVDCGTCHTDAVTAYKSGIHAKAREAGQKLAANCADCHTMHDIRGAKDPESSTYPLHLPATCGRCHGNAGIIEAADIQIGDVLTKYLDSIHGKVLEKSGLLVAPSCGTCHGNHDIRRKTDPESRVYRDRVPSTCGSCHEGIKTQYAAGIHGAKLAQADPNAPTCATCHSAHSIRRVDLEPWKLDVLGECGSCHAESLRTYRDTFHGQVTNLGFTRMAACADCHGAHKVLPKSDPASTVSAANRVTTCRKCHPSANENFAAYDPHADKHDAQRSTLLYYSAHFMEWLLIGVFAFFGLHTILWISRSIGRDARRKPRETPPATPPATVIRRFSRKDRLMHLCLMISFLGLAFTGMPLLFSHKPWAATLARFFGGFHAAGLLHRFFATVMIVVFGAHLVGLLHRLLVRKDFSGLWGPTSMIPQPRDLFELIAHVRWFLRLGPRPQFDHFTYWEKFDYWAVFWGMFIIGGSGLMLWIPGFFSAFLPGWVFNISLLIHGEEALLAVGFIFTVHFFNSHIRPDKFPMDTVIFSGTITEEELKHERPDEHARLVRSGKLGELMTHPEPESVVRWGRIIGTIAIVAGLIMVALIGYALLP